MRLCGWVPACTHAFSLCTARMRPVTHLCVYRLGSEISTSGDLSCRHTRTHIIVHARTRMHTHALTCKRMHPHMHACTSSRTHRHMRARTHKRRSQSYTQAIDEALLSEQGYEYGDTTGMYLPSNLLVNIPSNLPLSHNLFDNKNEFRLQHTCINVCSHMHASAGRTHTRVHGRQCNIGTRVVMPAGVHVRTWRSAQCT